MLGFHTLFNKGRCAVIGMVHVGALPGSPLYGGDTRKILDNAIKEALIYKDCYVDGILVENMHDIPYVGPKDISPETTAFMTRICTEIKRALPDNLPCGVQILGGCNKEAMAVAKAADFQFIRAEGFVFSHIADEGFTDACAGSLLRYRKQIDAEDVLILADIKKKHSSHSITSDVSLSETVKAAEFFLADGIILTGTATGDPASAAELKVRDCALTLRQLSLNNRVKLLWVPGHAGISGNERAIELARLGATSSQPYHEYPIGVSTYALKGLAKEWLNQEFTRLWQNANGMRHTRALLEGPSQKLGDTLTHLDRAQLRMLMGLAIGHWYIHEETPRTHGTHRGVDMPEV
uniref:uncharacterized protein F13E9.13, mitochondrial isoform X1 n=1 Tax=Osmia lignaria TaxID=473952 RepID=UPI0014781E69|nr:uncharacterized protein F13E9.13, mitochondrial isoform X1 [Osmia lignaria]